MPVGKHPSDSLRMWVGRTPFAGSGLSERFKAVEQFHIVLDSSVILRDLRYLFGKAGEVQAGSLRTAIMETIDAAVVVAYVPPLAIQEIEKHLASMAIDRGCSQAVAMEVWEVYRKRLVVLLPIREHRHAELEKRDATDMPFLAVFREASGDVLLSADNDLLDTIDVATKAPELMNILRAYTRHKAVALGITGQLHAGAVAVGFGSSAIFRIAKAGLTILKELPWWAQMSLAVGGLWLLQRPALKVWVADRWSQLNDVVEVGLPRLAEAVASASAAERSAQSAHGDLISRMKRPKRIGLRAAMFRVARDAGAEFQVGEFAVRVMALGYRTTARHFARYLEQRLRRDPLFERSSTGWRLVPSG